MTSGKNTFSSVPEKMNFPAMELEILAKWDREDILAKLNKARTGSPLFVFYEGPPTANGMPGIHHVLSRAYKDVMLRYKAMQGYLPIRRGGWDTHGLPVELEVEKELNLSSKNQIEAFGIEEFNKRCKESVFRYIQDWKTMTKRTGVWLDMEDAYITYENSYIENSWGIFKSLWDSNLIYEGFRVTPHCPRCDTSLSSHELSLGYKENTPDPSIFVRFPILRTESDKNTSFYDLLGLDEDTEISFLVWTTTPWTLSANAALAISAEEEYVVVSSSENDLKKEKLILATKLKDSVLSEDWVVNNNFYGRDFVGLRYEAPYKEKATAPELQMVYAADFVTTLEGTGIVHSAPAYGSDDSDLGAKYQLPTQHTVNQYGILDEGFPGSGMFVKNADRQIINDLDHRKLLFKQAIYYHTYPFCWRCDTPLLYYAKSSWYIRTTAYKKELLQGNESINWHPAHIKEGRFGEWLRNNVDWAVSRERYWGTPLPIWRCTECNHLECIGSLKKLESRVTADVKSQLVNLDLHRPYIDSIQIHCSKCNSMMSRILEVADAWYDSGAMPFSQWKYPVKLPTPDGTLTLNNISDLVSSPYYPADFITEAIDQTRGWFYSLLAESVLFDPFHRPSYQNVIVLGLILDENGEKMSKSKGNVVTPETVIEEYGADALRWYLYTAAPTGVARRFSTNLVKESLRRFFLTLWNTYSFFITYASIDGFSPSDNSRFWENGTPGPNVISDLPNELDRWVISELNFLVAEVTNALESYNPTDAGRKIEDFVDLLSNWYVRRSRRRFWKSENDSDKNLAYSSLYSCLLTLTKLIAPMSPFIADYMYSNLSQGKFKQSVHVETWPTSNPLLIDNDLSSATRLAMRIASLGRAARAQNGLKVRQPLSRILVQTRPEEEPFLPLIEKQVIEELNVKSMESSSLGDLATFSIRPNLPVLGPKYGKQLNEVKEAIASFDPQELASAINNAKEITIGEFQLKPDELILDIQERDGYATASEDSGGLVVAIDTLLTDDLKSEGLTRELVHRVQNLRREAGLDIADRIITYVSGATEEISGSLSKFHNYFCAETLTKEMVFADPPNDTYHVEQTIENTKIELGISKSGT
ncbi:MAG: isoleucine--tRNA ligase [Chloroflexi bacterium]|nr:isoleucine--tRNA ligase [Chloroflexota bacterium]